MEHSKIQLKKEYKRIRYIEVGESKRTFIFIYQICFPLVYTDEHEDLINLIRDYVESVIFSKAYSLIFNRIAVECEEQDLSIQNRISSLHWVTPTMLDAVLNEDIPYVREAIYKAINGKFCLFCFNKKCVKYLFFLI